jgi:hypothetical protein
VASGPAPALVEHAHVVDLRRGDDVRRQAAVTAVKGVPLGPPARVRSPGFEPILAFSADAKLIAAVTVAGVTVTEVTTGQPVRGVQGEAWKEIVAVSDARVSVTTVNSPYRPSGVRCTELEAGRARPHPKDRTGTGGSDQERPCALDADTVPTGDGHLIDLATGRTRARLGTAPPDGCAFSADGRRIATVEEGQLRVWTLDGLEVARIATGDRICPTICMRA